MFSIRFRHTCSSFDMVSAINIFKVKFRATVRTLGKVRTRDIFRFLSRVKSLATACVRSILRVTISEIIGYI